MASTVTEGDTLLQLNDIEARIVGSLIEKAITTPEYYPMTLNAITHACNQKNNRHPQMALDETAVARGLERLQDKGVLVRTIMAGSKVPKYRHVLPERVPLDDAELAVMCELMLRGPQTVGELRGRAARMFEFTSLERVQSVLDQLAERDEPLVLQLPREPGRKECRYAHLLSGTPAIPDPEVPVERAILAVREEDGRIDALEAEVAALRDELGALKAAFATFRAQFD